MALIARKLGRQILRSTSTKASGFPLSKNRRRRKKWNVENPTHIHHDQPFDTSKLDPSLISSLDSCFETASLSPYLPVPRAVARRMLELAQTGPNDIHYELGSGDGRVNFEAVDHFCVAKSVGVEIDPALIQMSRAARDPCDKISFIAADLMNARHDVWSALEQEATVVTMYFVENALSMLRLPLEKVMGRNPSSCRIVTCGYPMPHWQPTKVHHMLGLTIYFYSPPLGEKDEYD